MDQRPLQLPVYPCIVRVSHSFCGLSDCPLVYQLVGPNHAPVCALSVGFHSFSALSVSPLVDQLVGWTKSRTSWRFICLSHSSSGLSVYPLVYQLDAPTPAPVGGLSVYTIHLVAYPIVRWFTSWMDKILHQLGLSCSSSGSCVYRFVCRLHESAIYVFIPCGTKG